MQLIFKICFNWCNELAAASRAGFVRGSSSRELIEVDEQMIRRSRIYCFRKYEHGKVRRIFVALEHPALCQLRLGFVVNSRQHPAMHTGISRLTLLIPSNTAVATCTVA